MGETTSSKHQYRPTINLAEEKAKAKAMSAAEKRDAINSAKISELVESLSRENNVIVEYDPMTDTTYVAVKRSGTRYMFGLDGEMPCIFPMKLGWTIDDLLGSIGMEKVIYENAPRVDIPHPLSSEPFGYRKKYEIPYSSSHVRIRKGQVTFWSGGVSLDIMKKAIAYEIPNGENGIPSAVSFDMVRKPTWHYPEPKKQ